MSEFIRWMVYFLGGLSFVAIAGALYSAVAAARDKRKYLPPGRLIDVGGCKLHINGMGAGEPVVVLESGSGNYSLDWCLIQPEIARLTRVCSYDRAGHGWSGPGVKPRTALQTVEELHALLGASGHGGPYILVGHSLGGLYMEIFARRFPAETAGIVFVDCASPGIYAHLPSEMWRRDRARCRKMWLATRFGIARLGMVAMPSPYEKLPPGVREIVSAFLQCPLYWRTSLEQFRYTSKDMPEVVSKVGPFPDIPVVALTPANVNWLAAISPKTPAVWLEEQKNLARLSSHGKLIVVQDSGHGIHLDQPGLVMDVIRQMVEQVRRQDLTNQMGR